MKKENWKYLMRELFLYYRQDYIKNFVGTNKTSIYKWLKGKTYPRFERFQSKLIHLSRKIKDEKTLIRNSRTKESKLLSLSKRKKIMLNGRKIIINTIPIIFDEIKQRENKSANNWYIKSINNKYITIKYVSNYTERIVKLPTKLVLDENLSRIIGFWFGDGTTNKPDYVLHRSYLTFVNEDIHVLKHLKKFFSSLKQKNSFEIEIIKGRFVEKKRLQEFMKNIEKANIKFYTREHGNWNSLGACFHIKNASLSLMFDFIKENIEYLLEKSTKQVKGAFLGGYFTAEGNVSKINQYLTFNETKKDRIKLIIKLLKDIGFKNLYENEEGVRIGQKMKYRKKQFNSFKELILPHIFSENKTTHSNELFDGINMREIDLIYLLYLKNNPNTISKNIARDFIKSEDHINRVFRRLENSKIKLVERRRDKNSIDFFKINLTKEGENIILNNFTHIKKILMEIRRLDKFDKVYKNTFYITNPVSKKQCTAIKEMMKIISV